MTRAGPKLFTIPPGIPFAPALCAGVIERAGPGSFAFADTLILVPTRRATRALREAFAEILKRPTLLPRIVALADVDEEIELSGLDEGLGDLPAIAPLRRKLLLATLVQHWGAAKRSPIPLHHALNSAGELGGFLDEAMTQGADLARLADLAPVEMAAHWREVVSFLNIIAVQWPKLLEAESCTEAVIRRDANLRAMAKTLATAQPNVPVIAAGSTGSIPATAELLKTVAHLPAGAVVLPALDTRLDAAAWERLEPTHPQFGISRLLTHLGAGREDVQCWSPLPEISPARLQRVDFVSEALRPAPTTDAWLEFAARWPRSAAPALENFAVVEAKTSREEALIIACAMREALDVPSRTAALVTPDRALARSVASELTRWDIVVDDSAGVPLTSTAPGMFLSLLATAAAEDMAPVPLLSLLKHPLAAGGEDPAEFRRHTGELEIAVLRGLRPDGGLEGIARRLQTKRNARELQRWFDRLSGMLAEFATAMQQPAANLGEIAGLHLAAAEALAATRSSPGAARLWQGPAGESAAALLTEITRDAAGVSLEPARQYADSFTALAQSRAVREPYNLHPRLAILGPLEARLLHFDVAILGGLNEGKWPSQTASDPWLSRPMREALGLESPERRIGLAAHDFASLAALPSVLLTRSQKENGSPTVPSRWLLRVKQLAAGIGAENILGARNDLVEWARELDRADPVPRVTRPAPTPPVAARPRSLSVTEIEKWIRDPYAIYAKHVLRLRALDPLDQEAGPPERGMAIHRALERFLIAYPNKLPEEALQHLLSIGRQALAEFGAGPAVLALWMPRFRRAAEWFVNYESGRRKNISRSSVEMTGKMPIPSAFGFELRGRADRIDFLADGSAAVLDYKTGRVPSNKQIERLLSPQLPLEGTMLLAGAFGELKPSKLAEFVHVRLTGGDPPGEGKVAGVNANTSAQQAFNLLLRMVARYEDPAQGYGSWAIRERVGDKGDYDHLARVLEWSLADEAEE